MYDAAAQANHSSTPPDTTSASSTHTIPHSATITSRPPGASSTSTSGVSTTTSSNDPNQTIEGGKGDNVVRIAGGVAGGVVGLVLAGVLWSFVAKLRSARRQSGVQVDHNNNEAGMGAIVSAGDGAGVSVSENPFTSEIQLHGPGPGARVGFHVSAAEYVGRTHGTSPDGTQQPFPLMHGVPHGPHAAPGSGLRHPNQVDTSDTDSGYGPGSSLFPEHQ